MAETWSTSPWVFVAAATWLANNLPLLLLTSLLVKAVSCGRGGGAYISAAELRALKGLHLGVGASIFPGPFIAIAHGAWGWIYHSDEDAEHAAVVWFLCGAKPKLDVYAGLTQAASSTSKTHKVYRYVTRRGYSGEFRGIQVPSVSSLPPPHPWQAEALATLRADGRTNTTLFVHGAPGCGKSTLCEYVAAALTTDCDSDVTVYDLRPTQYGSGDAMWVALQRSLTAREAAAVFVVDEVDVVMDRVFNSEPSENTYHAMSGEYACPLGSGKPSWNALLDNLARVVPGMRIVTVLTSNRSASDVVETVLHGDGSPLHSHRIHAHVHATCATHAKASD